MSSTNPVRFVKCSRCDSTLPLDHSGPCPVCGGTRKTHDVHLVGTLHFEGSVRWQHIREYYEKHPIPLVVVILVTVGSPFLGLVFAGWVGVAVGLLIGVIAFVVSFRAVTKVREIRKRES
jgi:hypothetical protein